MSSVARDYYEVLGVARSATPDELRKAHRTLARRFHPDINKAADASKRFSEIQTAYDTLSDPAKRALYDQYGEAGVSGGAHPQSAGGWSDTDQSAWHDIFSEQFGGFGGGGSGPSRGKARRPRTMDGDDIQVESFVAFETAALGGSASISIRGGAQERTIDVRIPAGIEDGGVLRVRGHGAAGHNGGHAGDLLVTMRIAPHPWFTRDGLDLMVTVPVTIAECAVGAKIDVPLLKGEATVRIPAGTDSGKRIRLLRHGITDKSGHVGNLIVVVQVVAPKELSIEDAAMLETLGAKLVNPRENMPWSK